MAASNPPDVMAYLAPSNVSIYDHLAQVLATVHVGDSKDAKANFHKISREVLETTMAWRDEAPPSKSDMTSQQVYDVCVCVCESVYRKLIWCVCVYVCVQ
jgi:hypothetical protein